MWESCLAGRYISDLVLCNTFLQNVEVTLIVCLQSDRFCRETCVQVAQSSHACSRPMGLVSSECCAGVVSLWAVMVVGKYCFVPHYWVGRLSYPARI